MSNHKATPTLWHPFLFGPTLLGFIVINELYHVIMQHDLDQVTKLCLSRAEDTLRKQSL